MKDTMAGGATTLGIGLAMMIDLTGACSGGVTSQAPQGQTTEGRSTTFVRLDLSPTNDSGADGSATFTKVAAGTKVELELRDLPESDETYLAHLHPGSCEDGGHPQAHEEDDTTDHHGDEHRYEEHADAHKDDGATADEIEYPFTPVESNAAGEGLSTTVLEGVALDELLSDGPKYLNVHTAGTGDPPQLACANVDQAN